MKKTNKRRTQCEYTNRNLELSNSFQLAFIAWTQNAIVATKQMFCCTKPFTFSKDDWKNLSQWNEISKKDIVHS